MIFTPCKSVESEFMGAYYRQSDSRPRISNPLRSASQHAT
jgi:hypothetical protein